jgi:hypothetical protein
MNAMSNNLAIYLTVQAGYFVMGIFVLRSLGRLTRVLLSINKNLKEKR